jgi:hypothetical protein
VRAPRLSDFFLEWMNDFVDRFTSPTGYGTTRLPELGSFRQILFRHLESAN